MRRRCARHLRRKDEAGFTLVELLVSMAIFVVVLGIFGVSFTALQKDVVKQTGYVDAEQTSRTVFHLLDKQVRYANAVTTPGFSAGAQYVEWQSGDDGAPQTCTQWRWVPSAGLLQSRGWSVPGNGGPVTAPAWRTIASSVTNAATSPPFSLGANGAASQQLLIVTLALSSPRGGKASTTTSFAAANSGSAGAAPTGTCGQVARS